MPLLSAVVGEVVVVVLVGRSGQLVGELGGRTGERLRGAVGRADRRVTSWVLVGASSVRSRATDSAGLLPGW